MQYTTLKPKQIKEGIIAGASLDLQFFTNPLGTRTSRYVYNGCIVRKPVAYRIIQELELEGVKNELPNAHKCSGTGRLYPYPSVFCSMCCKPSIDLVLSEKDIDSLKEAEGRQL